MLCAVIAKKNFDEILKISEKIKNSEIKAVEFRFDFLEEKINDKNLSDLSEIFKDKIKIVTLMPTWEGGNFKGEENERLKLLKYYSNFADVITLELKAIMKENENITKECEKILNLNKKFIISMHNFERCYEKEEIENFLNEIENLRKFYNREIIAKIACKFNSFEDNFKIIPFLTQKNYKNSIFIGIGKYGKITRVLNYYFGFLTYVSVEEKTAEGQLSVEEFEKILSILGK